jgi:hypothetical protein
MAKIKIITIVFAATRHPLWISLIIIIVVVIKEAEIITAGTAIKGAAATEIIKNLKN